MDKILPFFTAPVFADEAQTRRARLLSFTLNLHLIIALSGSILFLILSYNEPVYALAALLTGLPALGMRLLLRRGRTRLAAALFMALIFFTMPAVGLASNSSVGAVPIVAFQFLTIVMAGLLVSNPGQFWFLTATCLLDGVLLYAEWQGWIRVDSSATPLLNWISLVLTFTAAAGLLWMANRLIRESFERAYRENEERRQTELEREHLIGALEAKNAELESFTEAASHDLKMPLSEIRRIIKSMEEDVTRGDRARLREDVTRISAASETMRDLLDELLFLAHIGRAPNPSTNIPFDALVGEALGMVDSLRSSKTEIVRADDLPVVLGDRPRLVEVVRILIDNAARATAGLPAARIQIGHSGHGPNGDPILFVRDNGRGIDPQERSRVFGLSYRRGEAGSGTGVDLAIVKKIVEVHGGRIWIESDGVGGATFLFTLPRGEE